LLIGMAVIALWPASRREELPVQASPVPAAAVAAGPTAVASAVEVAMVSPQSAPAASQSASAPVAVAMSTAAASAPTTGIVVFHAKGNSWVEVVDAKGAIPLRKLMASGETAGASGALPLQVTIGKVDMTEVDVRGKKFDLRPVSKDNVARFEIK
jgi:cytoskeleton protein RodZ